MALRVVNRMNQSSIRWHELDFLSVNRLDMTSSAQSICIRHQKCIFCVRAKPVDKRNMHFRFSAEVFFFRSPMAIGRTV